MGIYKDILESLLVEKPIPYNPNIHTKSGNAVLDKKGNKIGSYSKNKAGKAVVKPLEVKPDKEKPSPEKEPEKTKSSPEKEPKVDTEKEPTKSKLSDEEKDSLRTKDHKTADRQLAFNKQEMAVEVQRIKDVEAFSTELGQGSAKEIAKNMKVPAGASVILPNEKLAGKGKAELEAMFNGKINPKNGKFYPKLSDIKKAVKEYREDKNPYNFVLSSS